MFDCSNFRIIGTNLVESDVKTGYIRTYIPVSFVATPVRLSVPAYKFNSFVLVIKFYTNITLSFNRNAIFL
jgi:hypothetical protein